MSVRKRHWTTPDGHAREAWIVDYFDGQGVRRQKTFARKKDADAFAANAQVEIGQGVHVADSASITIAEAGAKWVTNAEASGLERSTIAQYRQHVELHIAPLIGEVKLSAFSVPAARAFRDELRSQDRSMSMVRKVMVSLGSLFGEMVELGLSARNPVREMRRNRQRGADRSEKRQKRKLRVGVDIPTPGEVRAITAALSGRWRPLLLTAIFTGLRSSELRGLRWEDVDFAERKLHVRQRADRYDAIGAPKSEAGERSVPLPPIVLNMLREWKLACPKGQAGLVFPNGLGKVESRANIINRGLVPAMIAAGVTVDGKAKYTGLHAFRHFYASWCINRSEDGGLGLLPKSVQERLGHASITITMDVYGHLFPTSDNGDELATAERLLIG